MMKDAAWYLEKYGESHQNPTNIIIHKIFVPLIMFSVIGLLWVIPTGFDSWFLNLGMFLVIAALGFYLTMGLKIFISMLLFIIPMAYGNYLLSNTTVHLQVSLIIFIVGWVMQFIGHKIEGKKPSFLDDLLFLLVGPVWVIYPLLKKLNLKKP